MQVQNEEVRFVHDNEAMLVNPVYNDNKGKDEIDIDMETPTSSMDNQDVISENADSDMSGFFNRVGDEGPSDDSVSQDSQISVEIEKEFRDYFRKQSNDCSCPEAYDRNDRKGRSSGLSQDGTVQTVTKEANKNGSEVSSKPSCETKKDAEMVVNDIDVAGKVDKEDSTVQEGGSKNVVRSDRKLGTSIVDLAGTPVRSTPQVDSMKPETVAHQTPTESLASAVKSNNDVALRQERERTEVNASPSKVQSTALEKKPDDVRSYFKLGMEGSYVMYENQYYSNSLASSKHDHQAERDKRRALGNKFRLYDFKWLGEIYQGPALVVNTLRSTLLSFESSIPTAFLHPMWYRQLPSWIKAVRMCKEVPEFAAMLSVLQRAIKPIIVLSVWREALGNVSLKRMQSEGKTTKKGPRSIRDKDVLDDDLEDEENGIIKPKGIFGSI